MDAMTRKELNKALRTQKVIFVWVVIFCDDNGIASDGVYMQVSAAALKRTLPPAREDDNLYNATIRDNEPDALYIN